MPRQNSKIKKPKTPMPKATADPVLICDADWRLEPSAGPNGAASRALAHAPFEHIWLLSHSVFAEHVAVEYSEDAVVLGRSIPEVCSGMF